MHRNRVLRPQHSVKVWWLDVGRCWPLKSAIGFDFWGRPGFFSFPKYVFHFPGVFISWALWVLTAKPACFWTACLACSVTCFTGPQGTPPTQLSSLKNCVAIVSSPLLVFMDFYFPPLFCHCILASGGIGGKWVCSTAMVTQKFLNLGFFLLAANGILMLSIVFSHRNILWHGI